MNLNQITVPALNISKSIEFYQKLGLKLIVHSGPDYARFVCPAGDSTFSLHKVNHVSDGEGVTVYFECEDLDDRVNQLVSRGISFVHLPQD